MFLTLTFPAIDPVLVQIGPFAIRWYALAYIVGLIGGWRYCLYLAGRAPEAGGPTRLQIDDFVVWATLGVILGGRLGYVLFYQPGYFLANPGQVAMVWRGGMSFHGGLVGVALAMVLFARRHGVRLLAFADIVACAAPIGLFLGRLANFVNAELYGRPSDVPWAMVFPGAGPEPRHPSQLYEAGLEGAALFALLFVLTRVTPALVRPGLLTGVFLTGYALSRIFVELFRAPDAQIGYLVAGTTMGQWLSLPLLAFGLALVARAARAAGPRV
ncbi:MAG: prolipoprotein diacylglyceryl transferase [Dongiaceae bacterium]